jgi:hypothetical protein
MRKSVIAAIALVFALCPPLFAAQCCFNGICGYASTQTIGPGNPITTLCGYEIYGSGGLCTINMGQDETVSTSNGSCVELAGSTKLNMNSHSITCTASHCGDAIDPTHDRTTSANQIVGPGALVGCWANAAQGVGPANGPMNDTITDVTVDLAPGSPSCTGSTAGLSLFKTVTRAVVGGASNFGIYLQDTASIADSIVHDNIANQYSSLGWNGNGIALSLWNNTTAGPSVSGTLVTHNTVDVTVDNGVTVRYALSDSTVRDGVQCDFQDWAVGSQCRSVTDAVRMSGVNFIDNVIYH